MADETTGDPFRNPADAFRQAGERARNTGNELSVKLIEQAENNTRAVFATMREIASADNLSDVLRLQGEFVRDQSSRAMEQARELGALLARFGHMSDPQAS